MFQSNALRGLLLFTLTTSIVKAEIIIDDEIEAVIIQGKINVFLHKFINNFMYIFLRLLSSIRFPLNHLFCTKTNICSIYVSVVER